MRSTPSSTKHPIHKQKLRGVSATLLFLLGNTYIQPLLSEFVIVQSAIRSWVLMWNLFFSCSATTTRRIKSKASIGRSVLGRRSVGQDKVASRRRHTSTTTARYAILSSLSNLNDVIRKWHFVRSFLVSVTERILAEVLIRTNRCWSHVTRGCEVQMALQSKPDQSTSFHNSATRRACQTACEKTSRRCKILTSTCAWDQNSESESAHNCWAILTGFRLIDSPINHDDAVDMKRLLLQQWKGAGHV